MGVEEVEEVSAVEEGRGGGTVPLNPNTDIILSLLFCPSTRTHTAWAQSGQRTAVLFHNLDLLSMGARHFRVTNGGRLFTRPLYLLGGSEF